MAKDTEAQNGKDVVAPAPSYMQHGEVLEHNTTTHDAVFGEITEGGPNYRDVGWLGTAVLMLKTQIGLGVLSIPSAFDVLGLIPGVIILIVIAIITTWSNHIVGVFKLNHPEVYGIEDVGQILFGRIGREILGAGFCLYFTFVAASAMLSVSIAFNALSEHGTCTAVFVAVAALLVFIFAIFTVTIAVGVQDRPADAPQTGVWKSDYELIGHPSFTSALSAISSLVFAYAGTPAFFNIASEMRDPRHYSKALIVCQTTVTVCYCVIGIVVYYFCGSYVASPALGSAGPLIKKIGYGIALPGLLVSGILLGHLPAKHVFIRLMRGTRHLTANTVTHWSVWISCTFGVVLIAYIVASAIPGFGGLWLYDNWIKGKTEKTMRWKSMVVWSAFVILVGTFLMIAGTYSTISDIITSYRTEGGSAAWSCADNSGTV
ncbi:hypothetical protein LQW54_002286 [Pestalotiopsis sp. IQ-011]